MYEFHGDKRRYFDMTYEVTKNHIVPYIEDGFPIKQGMNVLEIGCGEAGVLKAFLERGCQCTGIELDASRIEYAKEFLKDDVDKGNINFLSKDIYLVDPIEELGRTYDIIILKDVIEHIHNQEKFVPQLHKFLKEGGVVFFAFPPWMMPYGGHQQILPPKIASVLPYYHLLPGPLYPGLMKLLGVNKPGIDFMLETKSTGISIERFNRIIKASNFELIDEKFYLFNPIYEHKFGIKPRTQTKIISGIPWVRNFLTMGVYALVKAV